MNCSTQVYEAYKQLLLRYCLRITGSLWDAEDLLQDALLKLMRALEADPARTVTKAFLYRIECEQLERQAQAPSSARGAAQPPV